MPKKHDLPAQPFYWGDWFKAIDVQSLPRDTRCVWFEMLGRMWESNERGYLTINGKPMNDFAKANALGFGSAKDEYLKHEKLLEEYGIFSRRESDGAIFCRKILNDIELSEKRANAGSKGGKKTWSFAKANAKASGKANTEYEDEYENEDINSLSLNEKAIKIWRDVYLKNAGEVERQFVTEQIEKHDYKKAKNIIMNLKANGFFNIATMRKSLNEDGSIKPKEGANGKAKNSNNPGSFREGTNRSGFTVITGGE